MRPCIFFYFIVYSPCKGMSQRQICSYCGKEYCIGLYNRKSDLRQKMREEGLCFDCAYWKDYIEHPSEDTAIVNGALYIFKPITKRLLKRDRKLKGMIFARNMTTGAIVGCREYRKITVVPERFRSALPDQFRTISEETYRQIDERPIPECLSKGCWDRYHCFWYNAKKAEPNKPWNEIPHYHKPGGEHCESFINKETMYIIL